MHKEQVTITISKEVHTELEKLRKIKVGNNEIIEDRSRTYEKALIEGLRIIHINNALIKQLNSLPIDLTKIDISKLNISEFTKKK